MEIFLLAGLVLLGIGIIVEAYMVHNYTTTYKEWEENVVDYVEGFDEIKTVINGNAQTLRVAQEMVNKHEQVLKVLSIMIDIHSEALRIDRGVRKGLEEKDLDEPIYGVAVDEE